MSRTSNVAEPYHAAPHLPGIHVLLDIWRVSPARLDISLIEKMLRQAAHVAGATVLDVKLHSFGESGGITGVAILAESHITIHTWPELQYVAMDIFMCGACRVSLAVECIKEFLQPGEVSIIEHKRGKQLGKANLKAS